MGGVSSRLRNQNSSEFRYLKLNLEKAYDAGKEKANATIVATVDTIMLEDRFMRFLNKK
ncbi:MAG: hypothetical protein QXI61_02615 [Nitrososphaerota archaeon]